MIRTPFVRTGIPGGSSPLFRPAIYLLLTLAFLVIGALLS